MVWVIRLLKIGVGALLLGLMVLGIFVAVARGEIDSFEDLKASPNGQMIRVRAADGTVIQSLGPSFGRWLTFSQLPTEMKEAMVAVEDRRYYMHPGVDPIGITRSFYVRAIEGRWTQGGSTITQQLARNIYLNNNKEFGRKIREIILALAMETKFSKEQILELYLNKVYFGGGAYGVDAASRKFFDHGAEDLSLAEAAIIAGLVKAPSRYSPTADAKAALDRAGVVVEVMQDAGMITAEQAAAVKPAQVKIASEPPQDSVRYFTDWVLPQLDGLIDETEKPIDVWTTLDLKMQRAATKAIVNNVPKGAQGALVAIDRDGAVKAMVGGTDYVTSNYNRAVTAVRQPGSAWKLFVYLTALESGFRPEDKVVDEPVEIEGWQPKNSGGNYAGRDHAAHRIRLFQKHSGRKNWRRSGHEQHCQYGAALRYYDADQHAAIHGAWNFRGARNRYDSCLCRSGRQRPQPDALRHFQGHHDRWGCDLFGQAAEIDPVG